MENSIYSIRPYKYEGLWVFDDERVGLVKEALIEGMPEIIEKYTKGIVANPENGFTALFSATGIPNATVVMEWVREELSGNWYRVEDTNMEGWLCPALFKYFKEAPKRMFIKLMP